MGIHDEIVAMQASIPAPEWDDFEATYELRCRKLAGDAHAGRIKALPFPEYAELLRPALSRAIELALAEGAPAVYFEYDLDNSWGGCFFCTKEYRPASADDWGNDDWACDWGSEVRGPDLESASDVYEVHGYEDTPESIGSVLYLVARTTAAVGRLVDQLETGDLAITIAFHDQNPIVRLRHPPV